MSDNTKPNPEALSLALISKHLQNVLDELAIITAEIDEMRDRSAIPDHRVE